MTARACVHELFEAQVRRRPDAVALVQGAATVTYAELNRRANRLARHLVGSGVAGADVVAVRIPRSIDFVVAALAILKAGAAYLPIEDGLPPERQRLILTESGSRLVVTAGFRSDDASSVPPGDPWPGAEVSLTRDAAWIGAHATTDLEVRVSPEAVMYIPYTSGSTGHPKGTEVPHRSIPGFFEGTDYVDWSAGQVALHHSSQSCDGHVLELYPALLTGGRVVLFDDDAVDPLTVARTARDNGVTVLWLTATSFNTVVNADPTLLEGVESVLVGGETLSRLHGAAAVDALPGTRLVNGYGPSECTVFACVHPITRADLERPTIPIGRPVGDRAVYLLDAGGQPVPTGQVGELHIGGPSVARGYLRQAALTAERFVADPFAADPGARMYRTGDLARRMPDGLLEFVGRVDGQVKIRGFRVELGEVESVLREEHSVLAAAVTASADTVTNAHRLVAYVAWHGDAATAAAELRERLRARLPVYMVPEIFVVLDSLPLTTSGKVDRARLPDWADGASTGRVVDARTDVERCVAAIWADVFALPAVGRDDDFFSLGGHSLLGTRIISRLQHELGVRLTLRTIYDTPVLADLAATIEQLRNTPA